MACEILELRLSLIWAETNLVLLGKNIPGDAPLYALGRRASYEPLFAQVLRDQVTHADAPLLLIGGQHLRAPQLNPPWPKPAGQLFWARYLESSSLDNLSGGQAWRALVPLRAKFPCAVTPGQWLANVPVPVEVTALPEAFIYPHGVAFVLTFVARVLRTNPPGPGLSLFDAVELAFKIRLDRFGVAWKGDAGLFSAVQWPAGAGEMKLQELADKALAAVRTAAYGPAAPGSAPVIDPFTICTVVRGSGVDPAQPVDDDTRRALEAVTGWSLDWRTDPLPDLATRRIETKTALPNVLYGRRKARAVWFPKRFTDPNEPPSISCYHRNLTFASLQIESLSGLAAATVAELLSNSQLDSGLRDCARQAGGALARLYSGGGPQKKSYRSMSPRVQIEQNGFVADINRVRQDLSVGGPLV
jgi:hypothetical protein